MRSHTAAEISCIPVNVLFTAMVNLLQLCIYPHLTSPQSVMLPPVYLITYLLSGGGTCALQPLEVSSHTPSVASMTSVQMQQLLLPELQHLVARLPLCCSLSLSLSPPISPPLFHPEVAAAVSMLSSAS